MNVMNRTGQDSCSYQVDEICPLYHFLQKEDGEEEGKRNVGVVPQGDEGVKNRGVQASSAPTIPGYLYRGINNNQYSGQQMQYIGIYVKGIKSDFSIIL